MRPSLAYYPFNGNANDESGPDKDGPFNNDITVNTATLAADRFNCTDKAHSFDGSSAKMEAPHSDSLDMSNDGVPSSQDMTVAVWVKKDDLQNTKIAIVQKS
jgi:hypothetical protein